MLNESTSEDYNPDRSGHKTADPPAARGPGRPAWRPDDWPAVEEFLSLLARAVRQFRTYPASSPLCTDAIAGCHRVFLSLERRDRLDVRVVPREVIVDDTGVGSGTIVEHELARRLHRAHVAALSLDRSTTPRDLSRFCADVVRCEDVVRSKTTLAELLAEHGVDAIAARMAPRPEVLEAGAPRPAVRDLVEHERTRRQSDPGAGGPVSHLYPPDKGWVRLDPAVGFDAVSLVDLTILVEEPRELAAMLLRLTDDDPVGAEAEAAALEQKFGDVAMLLSALEPRLARVMFAKLSRAVLELQPDRRHDLLRRTILPGLLDGRESGRVLQDFPDVDLAESLCLLLDLEAAAPEVLTTALDRLDLSAERRQTLAPLLEARLQGDLDRGGDRRESAVERRARRLVRIEPTAGRSFAEFAAFDLALDDGAQAAIGRMRTSIGSSDTAGTGLPLLWRLVRLEPNPGAVEQLLRRVLPLFGDLERAGRRSDLATWAARFRDLADTLRESRPDVSDAISGALSDFCTPDRVSRLADLYADDGRGRADAAAVVGAFGTALAPAFVSLLDDPAGQSRARAIVRLMCEHAARLAPALVVRVGQCGAAATRGLVKVLGYAGPGYERVLQGLLGQRDDEQTGREALRALARIGTTGAAAIVAAHLRDGGPWTGGAAEEALWHFPPPQTAAILRDLLGRRDFVLQHPDVASRLIDRAGQTGTAGLQAELAGLTSLRFRFWNPALVRVALKARELGAA